MAVTKTARLNLTRWSDDLDAWDREDFDAISAELEGRAVGFLTPSTFALRPAAAPENNAMLHRSTDTGEIAYSTGAAWVIVRRSDSGSIGVGGDGVPAGTFTGYRRGETQHLYLIGYVSTAIAQNGTIATITAGRRPPVDWPVPVSVSVGNVYTTAWASIAAATGLMTLKSNTTIPVDSIITATTSYPI